jgi:hypothetical protein
MTTTHSVTFHLFSNGDPWRYPPLPLSIVDASDEIRLRLNLSTMSPSLATLQVEDDKESLLAKLQLPNGRTLVKPLLVDAVWQGAIAFDVGVESPHEWMAWSTMRVDFNRGVAPLMEEPGMAEAWLQMWELDVGSRRWMQVPMPDQQVDHDVEGAQLILAPSAHPRAMLAHLGTGSPQVVSLPMGQQLMVLLTRAHALPTSDAPRVLIGGYASAAEGILEFLRKGSLGAASAVFDPGSELANQLLHDKIVDPLAATAAGYYLLRMRDWERLPQAWLQNLAAWFDWIPDAILLRDASLIQRGMDASVAAGFAATSLKLAFGRGLPLFAEARWLIQDLLLYAEKASGRDGLTGEQRLLIRGILAGFQPAGLTFGFWGLAPDHPVPAQEARRLTRELQLQRRLVAIGSEVLDIGFLVANLTPSGLSSVSRALQLAAKGVSAAAAAFGGLSRASAPGDSGKTLFVRDIYAPEGRAPAAPQLQAR